MPRLLTLTAVVGVTLLGGLAAVSGPALTLVAPLLVFMAAAFYWRPPRLDVVLERALATDRAGVEEEVDLRMDIQDRSCILEQLHIHMPMPSGLDLTEGSSEFLVPIQENGKAETPMAVAGQRGYYVLPPLELEARDPFGLIARRDRRDSPQRLFVLPRGEATGALDIRVRRTRVYPGLIPAGKGGPGVEFFGLREYQTGDDWRWINHRATARRESELIVNEFELERAIDTGLLLDVRASSNLLSGNVSLLEHGIQAAATLADALLAYGNRVGLYLFGGPMNWTFPGSGKKQYEKILRSLASAKLEDSQLFRRLDHLPVRLFPSRCLLIMISPLLGEDLISLLALRAKGYQLTVIIPDPLSAEIRVMSEQPHMDEACRLATLERRHLLTQLARGGVQICEWDVERPLPDVIQSAFGRQIRRATQLN